MEPSIFAGLFVVVASIIGGRYAIKSAKIQGGINAANQLRSQQALDTATETKVALHGKDDDPDDNGLEGDLAALQAKLSTCETECASLSKTIEARDRTIRERDASINERDTTIREQAKAMADYRAEMNRWMNLLIERNPGLLKPDPPTIP